MNKRIALATTFALLIGGVTIAIAAQDGAPVTCKDGTMGHAGQSACSNHGGMQQAATASTPIDTTQGLTPPNKTATATKPKTHTTASTTTTRKKVTTNATRSPTAKCNDGAMYFSKERRGACASHGGVKRWID